MTTPRSLLFVYGTLMHGEPNHRLLHHATFVGPAATTARFSMIDLRGFPAIVSGGATAIVGEVFEVDAPTLVRVDWLESVPDMYLRLPLELADGRYVDAYVLPAGRAPNAPFIPSGDWRMRSKENRP